MTCPTRSLPLSPMRFVSGSMSTALIMHKKCALPQTLHPTRRIRFNPDKRKSQYYLAVRDSASLGVQPDPISIRRVHSQEGEMLLYATDAMCR